MHIRMDWRSLNFDWNRARGFLATAEEGSLSAGARVLGMTQSTLGRQVTALEAELGVVLFERVGRGLTLTPSGLELFEYAKAMAEGAQRLGMAAAGRSQSLEGIVRVSASLPTSIFELPRLIAKIREAEPGIQIEVVASDSASDLQQREADIAIRHFQPTEPTLITRKIGESPMRFYAARSYLAQLGNPSAIEDFRHADFIGFDETSSYIDTLAGFGLNLEKESFPVLSTNWLVQWELVKRGFGVGMVPSYMGDSEPLVARVLTQIEPFIVPRWLVAHRELKTSRRIRFVYDLLADEWNSKPSE